MRVLDEMNFPVKDILPLASAKSAGEKVEFRGKEYVVRELTDSTFDENEIDIAFFSAGGSISAHYVPFAAASGAVVIDNTSHFRMQENVPLVVPECNPQDIKLWEETGIIANPNCSTIQMLVALAPLRKYGIKRIVVSTYQSITGTGVKAVTQLENEYKGVQGPMAYHYPIHRNAIPHCDVFEENGYTKEEMKLVRETKKIFGDDSIRVTATAVRIPVVGGHSESVNVEFEQEYDLAEVRKLLSQAPGVILQDNTDTNTYPMPIYAHGKDEVFVGRVRRDETQPKTLNLWVVADNLRKGAATNTIQIAETLLKKGFLK